MPRACLLVRLSAAPQGVLEHITVNNFPIGRNVDEALRTLQARRAGHAVLCCARLCSAHLCLLVPGLPFRAGCILLTLFRPSTVLISQLQAIQYVAEHGEVCPAGWQPGDKTMVADPEKSLDYFASLDEGEASCA